jgi:hypothetical protein
MATLNGPTSAPTLGGLAGALERGRAARLDWTQDGTLLAAADFAAACGIPPSVLPELEACGELFSLEIEGARWYPAELLKLSPDESGAVCRTLAGNDSVRKLIFVMRQHGALGGQGAISAISKGQLAAVLRLAKAW